MTFLPVLYREMRAAARNANTYRVRFIAAFLTVLFSAFSLWFVTLFKSAPISPRELFIALTLIEFVFVCAIGFCLTADSISEEKREMTLDLLFLANLKSWDVVLGKLGAAIVRGAMALIGTLPVLAIPLLLGGTRASEFLQISASILMGLFFSMSAGLMFSACFRRGWTALGCSGALVLFFCAALPLLSEIARKLRLVSFDPDLLALPSPSYSLEMSLGARAMGQWFLVSSGIVFALSLTMLAGAIAVLPVAWRDRPARTAGFWAQIKERISFGSPNFRRCFRHRLLDINPVYWLSSRQPVAALGLLLFIAAGVALNPILLGRFRRLSEPEAQTILPFVFWIFAGCGVHALVLLRVPMVAAERFGEDRKTGALELLLSTPASVKEILRGHWRALRRYFAGPVLVALSMHLIPICFLIALQPMIGNRPQSLLDLLQGVWRHIAGDPVTRDWENNLALVMMLGLIPAIVLTWVSLAWLATWLSLRVRRTITVPLLALVAAQLPVGIAFAFIIAVKEYNRWRFDHQFSQMLFLVSLAFALQCAVQIFWVWFCRRQVLRHFRSAATDRYEGERPRRWWQFRLA